MEDRLPLTTMAECSWRAPPRNGEQAPLASGTSRGSSDVSGRCM